MLRALEQIPTPEGWRLLEDIRAGDEVFRADGRPSTVHRVTPVVQPSRACVVAFDDGTSIACSHDHSWTSYTKRVRKSMFRKPIPFPPEVVMAEQMAKKIKYMQESNHAVAIAGPAMFRAKDLLIDPYVLGLWLGDGTSKGTSITSADPEILPAIRHAGYEVSESTTGNGCHLWTILSRKTPHKPYRAPPGTFMYGLHAYDLFGNKHIPGVYLQASEAQRLSLLEGLMDTDGYCVKQNGSAEFYSTKLRLATEVRQLVESIGEKARLRTKPAMLNGKQCGWVHTVRFTPRRYVFRLERKRSRQRLTGRLERRFRYVVSVEGCPPEPMMGLSVASPGGLFLASQHYIVTHG